MPRRRRPPTWRRRPNKPSKIACAQPTHTTLMQPHPEPPGRPLHPPFRGNSDDSGTQRAFCEHPCASAPCIRSLFGRARSSSAQRLVRRQPTKRCPHSKAPRAPQNLQRGPGLPHPCPRAARARCPAARPPYRPRRRCARLRSRPRRPATIRRSTSPSGGRSSSSCPPAESPRALSTLARH